MQAAIQRTIDASPPFMEFGLAKKIAAWAHENREPNKQEDWIQFCMKRLRTLKSFKIFKSEIKKLKTYSGLCAFKGLSNDTTLMQIQSGRRVPLKARYFYFLYEVHPKSNWKCEEKKRMTTARRLFFGISQGIHCWSDYTVVFIIIKLWRRWRWRQRRPIFTISEDQNSSYVSDLRLNTKSFTGR